MKKGKKCRNKEEKQIKELRMKQKRDMERKKRETQK